MIHQSLIVFPLEDRRIPYRVWRIRAETRSSGVKYPGHCFCVRSTCTSTCTTDIRRRQFSTTVELHHSHHFATTTTTTTVPLQPLLSLTQATATAITFYSRGSSGYSCISRRAIKVPPITSSAVTPARSVSVPSTEYQEQ